MKASSLTANAVLSLVIILLCVGLHDTKKENVQLKNETEIQKKTATDDEQFKIELWQRRLRAAESVTEHWKKMTEVAQEEFFRGQKILFELNDELKRVKKEEMKKDGQKPKKELQKIRIKKEAWRDLSPEERKFLRARFYQDLGLIVAYAWWEICYFIFGKPKENK